jgi:hypothetical protein
MRGRFRWAQPSGQAPHRTFPGRSAARSDALQTRDRHKRRVCEGPGSAVHRHSASKTRVNALMALHRVRDTTHVSRKQNRSRDALLRPSHAHHHQAIPKNRLASGNKREAERRKAHCPTNRRFRGGATSPSSSPACGGGLGRGPRPPFGAHACGTRHRLLPRWLSPRTGFPDISSSRVFCPLTS